MNNNNNNSNNSNSKKEAQEARDLNEKVIQIRRVTKVIKGGKRLAFRAAVVTGDRQGKVSIALGKSREVPSAIRKAIEKGKKTYHSVKTLGGTIPHEVWGKSGASKVLLRPAPEGTGVIAGGSIRTVLEMVGLRDVVAKAHGSNNTINMAKAAINALEHLMTVEQVSKIRGVQIKQRGPIGSTPAQPPVQLG